MAKRNNNEATTVNNNNVVYRRVGTVEASNATDVANQLEAILLEGPALQKAKDGPGRPPAPEAFVTDVANPPGWAVVLTGTTRWIGRLDDGAGKRPDPSRTVTCNVTASVAPTERSERTRKGIVVEKLSREQAETLFAKLAEMLKG